MCDLYFGTAENSATDKLTPGGRTININSLPSEMLRKILQELTFEDLMNVMLVSRYWSTLGGDPVMWRKYSCFINDPADIVEKLRIPRLAQLEEVTLIEGGKYSDCHIEFLTDTSVRTVWLSRTDMTDVSPDTLAIFFNHCESILFEEDVLNLTDDQNLKIIELMSKKTSLKNFTVPPDVKYVPADTLAMALSKIEDVIFNNPTPTQMISLFTMMSKSSKVLHLHLLTDGKDNLIDLSSLPNSVFGLAISSLKTLTATLDQDKLTSLMLSITREETNITSLNLCESDLSQVQAEILARGLARVEDVEIIRVQMDSKQLLELCREMAKDYSVVKHMHLQQDLTGVPADLLVKAFNKLETLGIVGCDVTEEQTNKIFKMMSKNIKRTTIMALTNMSGIRRVSRHTLATAVNKLEWVNIVIGKANNLISREQLLAILIHASVQTSLCRLKIVPGSCDIPTDLVQAAKRNIRFIRIGKNIIK